MRFRMIRVALLPLVLCTTLAATSGATSAQDEVSAEPGGPVTILDGSGVWRVLHSWNVPMVQTTEGLRERREEGYRKKPYDKPDFRFLTRYPPAGWTQLDFDDSVWPRRTFFFKYLNGEGDARAGGGGASPYLRQLSLRGKFTVTDPAKVGRLWLSMAYRGGVAVYLNGREIGRAHLPGGKIEPGSLAEIYPLKAYLKDGRKPWNWWNDRDAVAKEAYPLRVRRLENLPVPASSLRKGTNVLAVEIHATAYPEAFLRERPEWATCGLVELHLQTEEGAGIVPNVVRPEGLQVWNADVAEQVHDVSWADPHERLRPISMAAARRGVCSGRVVLSSERALTGVRASISGLSGPGGAVLPTAAVKIWYGKFDPPRGSRWGGSSDMSYVQWGPLPRLRDDALIDTPPHQVPVSVKELPYQVTSESRLADGLPARLVDGAVQPVWLTVEVPEDAEPGDYRGTLRVTLDGHQPVRVPVELKVIDYLVPDPADYVYFMGMMQSPEGVALSYDVPLWSDAHCRLVGSSFEWIGKLGPKVLYLTLAAESQYGNQRSLVSWVKGTGGKHSCDFSPLEKYVDLALEHMGKPQFVPVGVWDSCIHPSVPQALKRDCPKYSLLDPKTGEITNLNGPKHGTPESRQFWQPVLSRVREILIARGLGNAMLLGNCADYQPDKATVGLFGEILPGVGWQATRHPPTRHGTLPSDGGELPILYQANVWGGWDNWDPDVRRVYGWRYPADPSYRVWLDRGLFDSSPICQFRTACEQSLLADRHGLGQIGADFWPVPGPDGRPSHTMVGRFPATSQGNLGIYAGQLLYPGPNGPVPTVRYQMMRENIQECEARIFLERLLLEEPSRLPGPLAEEVQRVLDTRTRWHRVQILDAAPAMVISWPYSGWQARRIELFQAAAEAIAEK